MRITHPSRVVFGDLGITKADVARYYETVAERMLPHVRGRPLTLLLCTETIDPSADKGGCQMMRHGKAWGPSALRRVRIAELHKTGEYLVADTRSGAGVAGTDGRRRDPHLERRLRLSLPARPRRPRSGSGAPGGVEGRWSAPRS